MNENVKKYLIKTIEPSIISLLLLQDMGKLINPSEGNTFENFEPNPNIVKKVMGKTLDYKNEFLEKLIEVFPENYRCNKEQLLHRLKQWNNKTSLMNVTTEEILEAAAMHVSKYESPYHGKLEYFIFKMNNGVYTSRMEDTITLIRESVTNYEGFDSVENEDLGYLDV